MGVYEYKQLSLGAVRSEYRKHLEAQSFSKNTIATACTDSFYLWRKAGRETFWDVIKSDHFEKDAKESLLVALRAHSRGDVDSLVNGYMAHLRRFRRFIYSDADTIGQTMQTISPQAAASQRISHHVGVPAPAPEEVLYYLRRWDGLENYTLQERALNRLFHQLCPHNKAMEDILLKSATLNDFYSTNIFSIYPVAKHIHELDIDGRLAAGDITLVDDIQRVVVSGKEKNFYSFATKYCSHHNEKDFPIYDSYVDEMLRYFQKKYQFSNFNRNDLKQYIKFHAILLDFRTYFSLEQFELKEVDKYLWQLGKDYFPKTYGKLS